MMHGRTAWRIGAAAAWLALAGSALPQTVPPAAPHAALPIAAGRALPDRLRGITIDSTDRLTATVLSVRALRAVPTVRLVLDPGTTPGDYAPAISHLRPAAYVMAELLDSEAMRGFSVAGVKKRARTFGAALGGRLFLVVLHARCRADGAGGLALAHAG